jgi:toxin-antitoxin system PIN domain toxin
MPASGVSLLDANVWLALAVSTHLHHALARAWFDGQADDSCAFCRITQMALLRHLTNPVIMKTAVQTPIEAWRTYETFSGDARVIFIPESARTSHYWKEWTTAPSTPRGSWTDRYLAALATAGGMNFATFDQDFQLLTTTDVMAADQASFKLHLLQ